ncbi:EF_hand_5 domain-containing protein, partial [Cephalotus follicularis]
NHHHHSMDNSSPKSTFGRLRRKRSPPKREKLPLSLSVNKDLEAASECSSSSSLELQRVFNYFDGNGDGRISAAELQSCVRTVGGELSMEEAEAAIKSSDLNGDGLLDWHEFQKLMETSSGCEEEELRGAFELFDMEASGCITPVSLKRMLSRLGESRSIKDCKAMIRAFDLNGDGVLTFDEFAIMMR